MIEIEGARHARKPTDAATSEQVAGADATFPGLIGTRAQSCSLSDYSAEYRRKRRKSKEQNSNLFVAGRKLSQETLPRENFLWRTTLAKLSGETLWRDRRVIELLAADKRRAPLEQLAVGLFKDERTGPCSRPTAR